LAVPSSSVSKPAPACLSNVAVGRIQGIALTREGPPQSGTEKGAGEMSRIGVLAIAASALLSFGAAHAADLSPIPMKAPVAEPPPALSGYLELYTGGAWNHEDETGAPEDSHAWVLGGAGRINYWWSPTSSVQFDVQGDGATYTGQTSGPSRFSAFSYLIGAHVNWRDQRGLLGLFGGAGDASQDEIGPASGFRHGLIGAEGQLYWNMITLYGQGGYDSTIGGLSSGPGTLDSIHAWFVRGTARGYLTPNDRLEGTIFYANGSHDFTAGAPNVDFNETLWRAKYEHKFNASPFALFAAYQGTRTAFLDEVVFDHRFIGGVRIYFGENTLHAGDVSGASLDIIEPLALLGPSLN